MKALRKLTEDAQTLELCDVAEPTPGPGQVVLRPAATGICGTDLHILAGEFKARPPVTLGHEVAGTIAALGPGVEGWAVGDRVTTETYFSTCGRCRYCRDGHPNLCVDRRSIGSMVDGGFAELVRVPALNLHALPDTLGFPEAALIEPLACVVRGLLETGRVAAGERAVITGPGAIGLLALQVARASGAHVGVVGTPADEARLALAAELGADATVVATGDGDRERVLDAVGGDVDVVIDCSGAPPAADLLLDVVRKRGRYLQVGLFGRRVPLDLDQVCYKELTLTGSLATVPSSWSHALRLAATGPVDLRAMVGRTYPLEAHADAFAAVRSGLPGKVLLLP